MVRINRDPFDRHVGRRVRLRRKMLGISQTTLGNAVGVTYQQLQKYEQGTNRIGSSRLVRIARMLKVPPAFFFEDPLGKEIADLVDAPQRAAISDFLATSDGLSLARSFSRLHNAKLRRVIVEFVEGVAKG